MIRMIASDLDGTLLVGGATEISARMLALVGELGRRGIRFCPASGRQYGSQRNLFRSLPDADELVYICENGAVAFEKDRVISKTALPRDWAEALARRVLDDPNSELLISGERTCYLIPKHADYVDHVRYFLGNDTTIVQRLSDVIEEILKISAYCMDGAENGYARLAPGWSDRLSVAVAGEKWVDCTVANKGTALRAVCAQLGIQPAEVIVFGDNFNDLEMFAFAGRSYAMRAAASQVRSSARAVCDSVEDTVERLLVEIDAGRL